MNTRIILGVVAAGLTAVGLFAINSNREKKLPYEEEVAFPELKDIAKVFKIEEKDIHETQQMIDTLVVQLHPGTPVKLFENLLNLPYQKGRFTNNDEIERSGAQSVALHAIVENQLSKMLEEKRTKPQTPWLNIDFKVSKKSKTLTAKIVKAKDYDQFIENLEEYHLDIYHALTDKKLLLNAGLFQHIKLISPAGETLIKIANLSQEDKTRICKELQTNGLEVSVDENPLTHISMLKIKAIHSFNKYVKTKTMEFVPRSLVRFGPHP